MVYSCKRSVRVREMCEISQSGVHFSPNIHQSMLEDQLGYAEALFGGSSEAFAGGHDLSSPWSKAVLVSPPKNHCALQQ